MIHFFVLRKNLKTGNNNTNKHVNLKVNTLLI